MAAGLLRRALPLGISRARRQSGPWIADNRGECRKHSPSFSGPMIEDTQMRGGTWLVCSRTEAEGEAPWLFPGGGLDTTLAPAGRDDEDEEVEEEEEDDEDDDEDELDDDLDEDFDEDFEDEDFEDEDRDDLDDDEYDELEEEDDFDDDDEEDDDEEDDEGDEGDQP